MVHPLLAHRMEPPASPDLSQHIRYHDISNEPKEGDFIITEKIDGINFGIGYLQGDLRLQSRNVILSKECNEFGLSVIIEPLIQRVDALKDLLDFNFIVFGEIFGKVLPRLKYLDTECEQVLGSTTMFFRAFDLYNVDQHLYLKYSEAISLFDKVGLPYVPILEIPYQTLDELTTLVETYPSAYSDQYVEGFVLKRDVEAKPIKRPIFKVKRKAFCTSQAQVIHKEKLKSYLNYHRFVSAYSKLGEDWKAVQQEMVRDALAEMIPILTEAVQQEVRDSWPRFQTKLQKYLAYQQRVPEQVS